MRQLWIAVLAVAVPACASAPVGDADLADLARADALVLEGCYDCLIEARDTYARVAVGRARPLVVSRLFETEVLIALREKEFVLDSAGAEARAAALVPELPPTIDAGRILEVVDLVLPDPVGVPVARMNVLRTRDARRQLDVVETLAAIDAAGLSPAVARYVAASLDCSYNVRPGRPSNERPERSPDAPPLVVYRIATCFEIEAEPLQRLRAASPRFVETALFEARVRLVSATQDGAPGARDLLDVVFERFPDSPAVTYVYGNYLQLTGDCREALRFFGLTLDQAPRHESAMLGRVTCESALKQHLEAIGNATTLVGWRSELMAEGYYWRAWNRHVRAELEQARADIEEARRREISGGILTLAGVIAHDQGDLPSAEEYLTNARDLSYGERNCTAAWYLGLVHIRQARFGDASSIFEAAMTCYEQQVQQSRDDLAAMEARVNINPAFKAAQIEGFKVAIRNDQNQYYAAAFNVANQAAQAGDAARARRFVAIADRDPARDPQLADFVRRLKEILGIGGA